METKLKRTGLLYFASLFGTAFIALIIMQLINKYAEYNFFIETDGHNSGNSVIIFCCSIMISVNLLFFVSDYKKYPLLILLCSLIFIVFSSLIIGDRAVVTHVACLVVSLLLYNVIKRGNTKVSFILQELFYCGAWLYSFLVISFELCDNTSLSAIPKYPRMADFIEYIFIAILISHILIILYAFRKKFITQR